MRTELPLNSVKMTNYLIFGFIFSVLFIAQNSGRELPKYIKRCSISKNIDKCMVTNGNEAIPHLLNGDKQYSIPSFNPLKLNEIKFDPSPNLKMIFTNISVYGFEETKVIAARFDKENKLTEFTLFIPRFVVKSNYETKGRVLLLPFEGTGPSTLELVGGKYVCKFIFNHMDLDSDKVLKMNSSVDYTVEKTIYDFQNLFNGNKQLGDEMNKFLNENHAELGKDFKPVFSETVNTIIRSVLIGLLEKYQFRDLFLP